MSKISSFILAGLFTASITACSQETINIPVQQTTQPSNVSTYSTEGLNSTMALIIQDTFKQFDTNKDKYVSLAEYKTAMTPPQPVEPPNPDPEVPPVDPNQPTNPSQPGGEPTPPAETPDQVANQISAQSAKASIPSDPTARFKKMDKNKDNKLSFTEVKNLSSHFIPSQKSILKNMARMLFSSADTNKNKALSRDEFMAIGMTLSTDGAGKMVQSMLFFSADKNKNESLGITEFEDVYYNAIRTMYVGKPNPTPQPVEPPVANPPADPVEPPAAPPSEPTQP